MSNINPINNFYPTNNNPNRTNNNLNTNQFALLLNSMLNNSAASIGNFSDTSNNIGSNNSDLFNMGNMGSLGDLGSLGLLGNSNGLGALLGGGGSGSPSSLLGGGQSNGTDNSMVTMLLMLLLQQSQNNNNNANNSLLNNAVQNCQHLFANNGNGANAQNYTIPEESAKEANPRLTSIMGERSPQAYKSIIEQFNVETNGRYTTNKQGVGDVYDNIFTWDVTKAMGAEIPHYISEKTSDPALSTDEGIAELDANDTNDWLNIHGSRFGWQKVSASEAQAYANLGMPAVTSYKNLDGGSGQLQVVTPSQDGKYDEQKGVTIAQAGSNSYNYAHITKVFGDGRLNQVEYFVHI